MKLPRYMRLDEWHLSADGTRLESTIHIAWWGVPLALLWGLFHPRTMRRYRAGELDP